MRYVLFPGYVESKTDGQMHWISIHQLLHLYAIPKGSTVTWVSTDGTVEYSKVKYVPEEGDIACLPRYDGDYPIFKEKP